MGKNQSRMAVYFLILAAVLVGCQKEERIGAAAPLPVVPALPVRTQPETAPTPAPAAAPAVAEAPKSPTPAVSPIIAKPLVTTGATATPAVEKVRKTVSEPHPFYLATLEVEGYSSRNAQTGVMLAQVTDGKEVSCEIVKTHKRIRKDAKWSPLPLILYNPAKPGETLSPLFNQTLDFPEQFREATKHGYQFIIDFQRGKHFRALWRVETRRYQGENREIKCKAQLDVCFDPELKNDKFHCTTQWHEMLRLITHVDPVRWLRQSFQSNEREKDDIAELELELRDLDEDGYPTGDPYMKNIPQFK